LEQSQSQNLVVAFEYLDSKSRATGPRELEIYFVGPYYVYGFDRYRRQCRLFVIERISNAKLTSEICEPPQDFTPPSWAHSTVQVGWHAIKNSLGFEDGDENDLGDEEVTRESPIERLGLSPKVINCLQRAHISKVSEALAQSDQELLQIRNFGEKDLTDLRERLSRYRWSESNASEVDDEDEVDVEFEVDDEDEVDVEFEVDDEVEVEVEFEVDDEDEDEDEDEVDVLFDLLCPNCDHQIAITCQTCDWRDTGEVDWFDSHEDEQSSYESDELYEDDTDFFEWSEGFESFESANNRFLNDELYEYDADIFKRFVRFESFESANNRFLDVETTEEIGSELDEVYRNTGRVSQYLIEEFYCTDDEELSDVFSEYGRSTTDYGGYSTDEPAYPDVGEYSDLVALTIETATLAMGPGTYSYWKQGPVRGKNRDFPELVLIPDRSWSILNHRTG